MMITCKMCKATKKYYAKGYCNLCYYKTPDQRAKARVRRQLPENKIKLAKRHKKYHEKNRDYLTLKMRERYHNLTPEQLEVERLRKKQSGKDGAYKKYHHKNKVKRNAQSKQWHLDNPTYHSEWVDKNRESIRKSQRKYNENHREQKRIARINHPEWRTQYPYTISTKISSALNIPHSEIANKIGRKNNECKVRDNLTCQICGSNKKLRTHHIFYKTKYPKLALLINNLITLCEYCHNQIHWYTWTRKPFLTPESYSKVI